MAALRYEIGDTEGGLDMAAGLKVLREVHPDAKRIRVGVQPDMGTWWGANQPPVIAFSLEDRLTDHASGRFRDAYRREIGSTYPDRRGAGVFLLSRRVRK